MIIDDGIFQTKYQKYIQGKDEKYVFSSEIDVPVLKHVSFRKLCTLA